MNLQHIDNLGKKINDVSASDAVFNKDYNESLVHQVLVSYRSNARGGNRAQKDRSMVKCSTRKPWKQKGTGRARAGTAASPLWRGGGRVFPSSPEENFHKKINKKMYKACMSSILSQLAREDRVMVVDELTVNDHKTKNFYKNYGKFLSQSTLVICDSIDKNLILASRNIPNLLLITAQKMNPEDLVKFKSVLISLKALPKIEGLLS